MTPSEIEKLLAQLQYKRDVRRPPDARRRGQFCAGWADATVRGERYAETTLTRLTWHNLGYRLGQFFGQQSSTHIRQAYEILAALYQRSHRAGDWRTEVQEWLNACQDVSPVLRDSIVSFFELAFDHTRCPTHAWFGVHQVTISLVVGGIFLAAVMRSGQDRGFWLLVDQLLPAIDGVAYRPVQATRDAPFPLFWAHAPVLSAIPNVVAHSLLWESYAAASEKIRQASRIASDRDVVQTRRKKKRLSDFWVQAPSNLYPDELEADLPFREGARYQVTVNAYERDPRARRRCLEHYGTSCVICGFNFGGVYGEVATGFMHVHHLRPLAEIGEAYTVDPLQDLRNSPNAAARIFAIRLITWNCCRGNYEAKRTALLGLQPDVAVMQEARSPGSVTAGDLWLGPNHRAGIGILARNGYQAELGPVETHILWSIVPLRVIGPCGFHLLAVWTRPEPGYLTTLSAALDTYEPFLRVAPSVVMGDFNSNAIWDRPRRKLDFSRLAQRLERDFGLRSAYHTHFNEAYGQETRATHYFRWSLTRPYHIDYCFVPNGWLVERVCVPSYESWSAISDHRPLIVDVVSAKNPAVA